MIEKEIYDPGYRKLVARLKHARKKAGMSQEEVAGKLGCCRTRVAKIEQCELGLHLLGFARICRVYGLDPKKVIEMIEKD